MDNFKGKLQEFCQAKNLPFPIYDTEHLDGPPHAPQFISTVMVKLDDACHSYKGTVANNKKLAEGAAAKVAMNAIEQRRDAAKLCYIGPSVRILVDIENQQKILDVILERVDVAKSNIDIIIFVTENSPLSKLTWDSPSADKIQMMKIHSIRSDAADTFMIFEAGRMMDSAKGQGNQNDRYLILSQDHFAKTLEECFILYKREAKMASSIDTVLEFLT